MSPHAEMLDAAEPAEQTAAKVARNLAKRSPAQRGAGGARPKQSDAQELRAAAHKADRSFSVHEKHEAGNRAVEKVNTGDGRLNKRQERAMEKKMRGQIAEEALDASGYKSLNKECPNCPVYDMKRGDVAASVKTHIENSAHPEAHLAAYAHDLRVGIGATEAHAGKYAGKNGPAFAAARLEGTFGPRDELAGLTKRQLQQVFEEKATLFIPSDQVQDAQKYVRRCATKRPELYGLSDPPKKDEMDQLVGRIRALPMKIGEIDHESKRRMQQIRTVRNGA